MDPFYTPELKAAWLAHWKALESVPFGSPEHDAMCSAFVRDTWKEPGKAPPDEWMTELLAQLEGS